MAFLHFVPAVVERGASPQVAAPCSRVLHARCREAKAFYLCIAGFTVLAVGLNFLGFNPIKALVWSGIVQGFSTPPLLLILLMTNNRAIMGDRVNSLWTNILGWVTVVAIFAASIGLVVTWFL